ncbi:MAG TPA: hypothetical protein VEL76_26495 [Gemmataceae bacterium]|nr:hypothetical protein [Gemmataceae bacterium]
MSDPRATHTYTQGGLNTALEFLKRTRSELRELRKVRVWKDRLQIIDINNDRFEIHGLGYGDADLVPILDNLNTNFNPRTIHDATDLEYKEFLTGRRRAWAEDRVM